MNLEEKKHERSGSMGLLISPEQSPPSSSGIISLKDKKQHKTASCSAPSATRGLGAGRPQLLTTLARHGFRSIFHHLQPKKEMSWVYLYQESLRKILKNICVSVERNFLKNHSKCQHLKIWHFVTSLLSICPQGQPHRESHQGPKHPLKHKPRLTTNMQPSQLLSHT